MTQYILKVAFVELEIMAKTVWGEARGEGYDGKVAVANTILNRVRRQSWMGKTIWEVCTKPYQFSCWNQRDANFQKVSDVTLFDPAFRTCVKACIDAIDFFPTSQTNFYCHYHHKDIHPSWADGHTPCDIIGNHVFYDTIL